MSGVENSEHFEKKKIRMKKVRGVRDGRGRKLGIKMTGICVSAHGSGVETA